MPRFHIDHFYFAQSTEKPVGILSAPDSTQSCIEYLQVQHHLFLDLEMPGSNLSILSRKTAIIKQYPQSQALCLIKENSNHKAVLSATSLDKYKSSLKTQDWHEIN